uniref:Uncharacterized protein n=1 Tax=Arundo donax TaxID=35708 RepID=A0A0A9FYX9_ARUDO
MEGCSVWYNPSPDLSKSGSRVLDPLPRQEVEPAVGVAERSLPDVRVAELADRSGVAPEDAADGSGVRAVAPFELEGKDRLPAPAPGASERGGADGVAEAEPGEDGGDQLWRKGIQDRRLRLRVRRRKARPPVLPRGIHLRLFRI